MSTTTDTYNIGPAMFTLMNMVWWYYAIQALLHTSNAWVTNQCPTSALWLYVFVTVILTMLDELKFWCYPKDQRKEILFSSGSILYEGIVSFGFIVWGLYEMQQPCVTDAIRDTPLYQMVNWLVWYSAGIWYCLYLYYVFKIWQSNV